VNGNATDIVANHFALAGMQPCANVDPEWAYFLRNGASAADTARRAIESRQNAVPSRLDLMAAKASEIASDRGVMFVEEIAPAAISTRSTGTGAREPVKNSSIAVMA
jgi:hypothetical protein